MPKIINKIVKVLIISDFFLNLGWGLLAPVFAIFILENIVMHNVSDAAKVAGFAALFYWITKSFLEIPIGRFLDKKHGEKDDFWFMVIGTFITALVPIGYLVSSMPWHIYFFQVIHAIGMAMALPSWLAIFTRHIDKGREAFEWGMATTSIGMGAGIAGGVGGIMAGIFGFNTLFIFVSMFNLLSAILLLFIRNNVFVRDKDGFVPPIKSVVEP
ncbi:MAG: MFS transporter [Candidatus Staskawiczbacteria bacterium]|nr:MFS transporter [Candidatus Staskawiczbacteria bacterium]